MRIPDSATLFSSLTSRVLLKLSLAAMLFFVAVKVHGSEVSWTRFQGTVKALNRKTKDVTLQLNNKSGDLVSLKVTDDVEIQKGDKKGKDMAVVLIKDLSIDDEITLLNVPHDKAQTSVDEPDMAHPR